MPTRVLVFGASATLGFWDPQGGWVNRVRRYYDLHRLNETIVNPPTVYNLAISGDTSSRLAKRFRQETLNRKFPGEDFAFILSIGTNNSFTDQHGKPGSSISDYTKDLSNIIAQAREFSDKIMFVGFPSCDENKTNPTAWAPIYYTNERLKKFESAMERVCARKNVACVPLFDTFEKKTSRSKNLFVDGLHLNASGHKYISKLLIPHMNDMLGINFKKKSSYSQLKDKKAYFVKKSSLA